MVRCFLVGCDGFKFKFEIEDSRWFLQFGLWVKVLCTRSEFLLFMLLSSLLQELRRVFYYAIMMLLAPTIFQGVVLEAGGHDVVVSGSLRSLHHRRSMTLFFFLFSLPGATLYLGYKRSMCFCAWQRFTPKKTSQLLQRPTSTAKMPPKRRRASTATTKKSASKEKSTSKAAKLPAAAVPKVKVKFTGGNRTRKNPYPLNGHANHSPKNVTVTEPEPISKAKRRNRFFMSTCCQ